MSNSQLPSVAARNTQSSKTALSSVPLRQPRPREDLANVHPVSLPATGFVRQSQVLLFVPFSKSTLWRRIQLRTFPAPIKLSPRITVWQAEAIRQWIDEQALAYKEHL